MNIIAQRLGLDPEFGVAVWVTWFDLADDNSLLQGVTKLAPYECPECHAPFDLARYGGVIIKVAETPNCISVSDRCAHCQARLHFDATPPYLRHKLHWPRVAVGAPLDMPNLTVRALASTVIKLRATGNNVS